MALQVMEGFDAGDWPSRIASAVGTAITTGRTGSARQVTSNTVDQWAWSDVASDQTVIVGFAILFPVATGQYDDFLRIRETTTEHVRLTLTDLGEIVADNGSGVELDRTNTGVITRNVWYYVELKVDVHDSAGVVQLRVDGGTPPGWADVSGADTRNGGSGVPDNIAFSRDSGVGNIHYDDLYILDTSGSVNNDFLGDVRVYTLLPNGNGNYSNLVGQDADSTNNYLNVDESGTPDDDATYNQSTSTGAIDTYAFSDLSGAGSVLAVQASAWARKDDAGAKSIRLKHRLSGVDSNGADQTLGTAYAAYDEIWELDPSSTSTPAWTTTTVNGSEFGVEVRA